MTVMVWSAATGNVGLGDCGFQRHRTGSFDWVQPSSLSLRNGHTEHRVLVHNLANDRHSAFDLKAIVPVGVALLLLMPRLAA
jgi:hypothetical protein